MFSLFKFLFEHYLIMIFLGGLIFFISYTPAESLDAIVNNFTSGNIIGSIEAIFDASIAFAENTFSVSGEEEKQFDTNGLSDMITRVTCKMLKLANFKDEC